jgi:hypothetical protein
MMLSVFAALTVAAIVGVITTSQFPQDPTGDEISQLIVLGFIP